MEHEGARIRLARILAWLAVAGVTAWLLSLTLREIGGGTRFGGIRFGIPKSELNLRPFVNKAQSFRNLESPSRAVRGSAQTYLFVDVLGNVAVFVPLGASLAAASLLRSRREQRKRLRRWWLKISLAGLALSLSIELGQLAIPGRVTDVDDVILNTLGTATGALLVWGLFRLTNRT